eukprot:g17806.t1
MAQQQHQSMAAGGGGSPTEEFNPALVAVKRPVFEHYKKGEIMPEADFYAKYYHFSHKPVRDYISKKCIVRLID